MTDFLYLAVLWGLVILPVGVSVLFASVVIVQLFLLGWWKR